MSSDETLKTFYRMVATYEARQEEIKGMIKLLEKRHAELEIRKLGFRKMINETLSGERV